MNNRNDKEDGATINAHSRKWDSPKHSYIATRQLSTLL